MCSLGDRTVLEFPHAGDVLMVTRIDVALAHDVGLRRSGYDLPVSKGSKVALSVRGGATVSKSL
jgi:hypothetical protein